MVHVHGAQKQPSQFAADIHKQQNSYETSSKVCAVNRTRRVCVRSSCLAQPRTLISFPSSSFVSRLGRKLWRTCDRISITGNLVRPETTRLVAGVQRSPAGTTRTCQSHAIL